VTDGGNTRVLGRKGYWIRDLNVGEMGWEGIWVRDLEVGGMALAEGMWRNYFEAQHARAIMISLL
jgi:hypothetical protein